MIQVLIVCAQDMFCLTSYRMNKQYGCLPSVDNIWMDPTCTSIYLTKN